MTPAPKRRWIPDWLRYGPRWDFPRVELGKTNPRATRQSVIRWAAIGAVGGVLFDLYYCYHVAHWLPLLALPVAVIFGAFVGGLVEWQMDDGE